MSLFSMIEALMIVTALSSDAFVSAFAYGTNKIKIPFSSIMVISVVCSVILAASLLLGAAASPFIPRRATALACFLILFVLGMAKFFNSTVTAFIRKHNKMHKDFKFSAFNLKFVLHIYANPQEAYS